MPRALVVDDDPRIAKVLGEVCGGLGLEVATARDGVEALATLRRDGADLVLLDVDMPRLDGFGVLRALRSDPIDPNPSVIVVTASHDAPSKLRCAELGALDYVDKPFRIIELQHRIQRVLALSDMESRLREAEQAFWELRTTDQTTGVGSFSHLSAVLDGEFRWAQARGAPLSCVVVSDEHHGRGGAFDPTHEAHQERLRTVTQVLTSVMDTAGRIFRVDATELVLLVPGATENDTRELVKRMVQAIKARDDLDATEFALASASYPHPDIEQPTQLYRAVNITLAQARSGQGKRVRYFEGFADRDAATSTKLE